jgi:hypothetical protein
MGAMDEGKKGGEEILLLGVNIACMVPLSSLLPSANCEQKSGPS